MEEILEREVKRRSVLKGISILSLIPFAPELAAMQFNNPPYKYNFKYSDFTKASSSCAMECLHCNLTAYSYKGKVIKVEAREGFNVKGCFRGLSRAKWVHHKERLTHPLLRVGEKGKGEFKKISWDEALDLVESNIRQTLKEQGNKGLMFVGFTGNMDSIKNGMGRAFFDYLGGCTRRSGSICCGAAYGTVPDITGYRFTDTRDTIADSKYLLCWGNNPAVTLHAYWKEFNKAKERGARIVVIDPRFNETAAKADEWVPIIPGTDTALAMGMMKVIFDEGLTDEKYLKAHTGAAWLADQSKELVFENSEDKDSHLVYDLKSQSYVRHDTANIEPALWDSQLPSNSPYTTVLQMVRAECDPWTLEATEKETSVPAGTVHRLARDFGTIHPAMIIFNMSGAQRVENGAYAVATQHYIPLITGNIGKKGAGILDAGGVGQMQKFGPLMPPPPTPKQKIAKVPMAEIGRALLEEDPHKIDFFYSMTFSPLTQLPNTNKVKEGFKNCRFVVVADNLMTDSAKWADLVLPVTTIFEDVSLMAGPRSHYVQLMEKAVEPPGEAKPDYWIFARLAERFGFGEAFNQPIEHYIENKLRGTGITIEQLKKGPVKPAQFPWVPFDGGKYYTSTGKANFYLHKAKRKGFNPIAHHMPIKESPTGSPELAKKYPLMAVQRKLQRSVHTSHSINEYVDELMRNEPWMMIHPDDAKVRGIEDGQMVITYNDRGEHPARAEVTTHIMKGVISLENGWMERHGGSSSSVTNDMPEPIGHGQCCNSTLVNVRPMKEV
ncbi:DMSO reductase subunit A [Vibrio sp. MACH09]|uniref:molybdopterin-containing oxidoreductase family protein n=1 Tax=Vibrio sp. MACH09 TaxID=3025122 RepID=UPI00278ED463|nr:molybdopterin-dependent oxidoreductase [Vibrio sp. MACH09]GLO60546.1 DMSO reductase subunit A [Vibrio sp. MACH09]